MLALFLVVAGATPTFTLLPPPPGSSGATASALSDDGRVVFGRARFGDPEGTWRPCRWVNGRVETLPLPERIDFGGDAIDVADTVGEGSIAVGTAATMKGDRACRWVDKKLELLPLPLGAGSANALCVARDGSAVGTVHMGRESRTIFWHAGKATLLPFPKGRNGIMVPTAISADGRLVVGRVTSLFKPGAEPWMWRAGRTVQLMKRGRQRTHVPCGLSADGRTTLWLHGREDRPYDTGTTVLERLRGYVYPDPRGTGARDGYPPRMDAAATAIVINVMRHSDGACWSVLWTQKTGTRDLRSILGKNLPEGSVISVVTGVARSKDRRVVVIGTLEDGRSFLASVPG